MKPLLLASALLAAATTIFAADAPPAPATTPAVADSRPGVGPFTSRPPYQAEHIAGFAKRREADRGAVVFLGDSLTEWWPNFGAAFPHHRVANRGIASDTTRGMLCRLQDTVLALDPQAVVITGGTNDLIPTNNPPGTPETVATNIRLLIEAIRKHDPKLPVFVGEILPSKYSAPEIIVAANAAVDKVVADFPQAVRVRTHAKFLNADGVQNKALFRDGVHLKPAGYALWQAALSAEFKKAGLKRSNPGFGSDRTQQDEQKNAKSAKLTPRRAIRFGQKDSKSPLKTDSESESELPAKHAGNTKEDTASIQGFTPTRFRVFCGQFRV